jgi:hypothetical protein
MTRWKTPIILVALATTLLLFVYDFCYKEVQGVLTVHGVREQSSPLAGNLSVSNMRYDTDAHGAKAALALSIQGPDSEKTLKTVAFSPLGDQSRTWLLSVLQDCRLTSGNTQETRGQKTSKASFECGDMAVTTITDRPQIWYPFDQYNVTFSPLACVNNSGGACTSDDKGETVSIDSIQVSLGDQNFTASSLYSPNAKSYSLTLARRFFVRLVSIIFLVLSFVFMVYILIVGDPKDLLAKSLGFFATLWGLRSLIVPSSVNVFPTLVDYSILSIFCLFFLLVLLKIKAGEGMP